MPNYKSILIMNMKRLEWSSLVTALPVMPFVLMQFAEQTLKLGVITPMMMLSSILMIFLTSPSLAWIVAFAVPFLAVVVIYVGQDSTIIRETAGYLR